SGRPRCSVDDSRPLTANTTATASETNAKPGFCGTSPNGAAMPTSSSSPNPAPDAVLKKMIDKAGCTARSPLIALAGLDLAIHVFSFAIGNQRRSPRVKPGGRVLA